MWVLRTQSLGLVAGNFTPSRLASLAFGTIIRHLQMHQVVDPD